MQNRRASPGPGAGPSRMVKNCKVEKDKFGDIIKTCGVNGCTHRTGNRNMKRHWSDAHNIDVVWHYCGIGDCKVRGGEKDARSEATKTATGATSKAAKRYEYCAFSARCYISSSSFAV